MKSPKSPKSPKARKFPHLKKSPYKIRKTLPLPENSHRIFCEFVDYLLKNNITGIFHFPQWSNRWVKGFEIENTELTQEQITSITEYLNKITGQLPVINIYKNNKLSQKTSISTWKYSARKVVRDKHPHHYWEPEPYKSSGILGNIFIKENYNINLEKFCRDVDMCKVLKKYGPNKVSFYAIREAYDRYAYDQWYSWSYIIVISKDIEKIRDKRTREKIVDSIRGDKMTISKSGCTLNIPINLKPQ